MGNTNLTRKIIRLIIKQHEIVSTIIAGLSFGAIAFVMNTFVKAETDYYLSLFLMVAATVPSFITFLVLNNTLKRYEKRYKQQWRTDFADKEAA